MTKTPYYIEGRTGWFVAFTHSQREAHAAGVEEFGRGGVKSVRPASQEDIARYAKERGLAAEALIG